MKKDKPFELKTKRLILRALSPEEIKNFACDPEAFVTSLGYLYGEEKDEHFAAACREMSDSCEDDPVGYLFHTLWLAVRKTDSQIIGSAGFLGSPNEFGEVEVGYGTGERFRENAFAAEYLTVLVNYVLSREDVNFVTARTEEDNTASRALLEKCGFAEVGGGDDGTIRYEKEKPLTSWISVYMCLGLAVGMSFGMSLGNQAIGMSAGILIGVALGIFLDSKEKARRAELEKKRGENRRENG